MTCRFPNDCRKKPDPRYTLCRGCALAAAKAKPNAIALLQSSHRAFLDRKFAWLPQERRAEYDRLTARKFKADEAKQIILQDMAR